MKNYIRYIIFAVIFIVVVVTTIIASCFFVSWYENKPRNCAPPKGKKLVDEKWREAIDVEDSQPESFKEFILHNNTPVLLDDLYKNLDQESIRILDMMLIKVMNLPDTKYAKYFLMDYAFTKSLKNKRELAYLKHRNENYQKVLKKYKFVDGYPGSSRLFINKLNFIDTNQKTLDYIKNKIVIDGGAYNGDCALIMSEFSPSKIYSFDISRKNVEVYKKTMEMNNVPKDLYEINRIAIADKKGTHKISSERRFGGIFDT